MGRKFWTEGAGSFIIAVLIALTIRWAFIEAYVIPSGSMLPTLLVHDHIFVNKIVYGLRLPFTSDWLVKFGEPSRGDVLVFKYPEKPSMFYIKRVVGTPGDRVFYENGSLFVNEELIEKQVPQALIEEMHWLRDEHFPGDGPGAKGRYVHWEEKLGHSLHSILLKTEDQTNVAYGPYEVPEGHYFVMGDNRDNSQDSRFWEPGKQFVPREYVVGRAMFVWLSCDKTLPVVSFLCSPFSLRWDRFFYDVH
ncbi:MAG: signal peptidase I [Bdellovibrionaceae bacterium]|nr:signal peptidase I [Bdellovibrionales bacterium]MCB9086107.1 signal peptidase I [Pseudobdellovibrionaceae bacterium]